MECVNLNNNTIKILGIHFSYNKSLENDENYKRYIIKIEKLLKLWRMRQLTIEVKILIFKTLAISKVVHLALVKDVPSSTIAQLEKIQKQFIWKYGNPKLKYTTLCNEDEQGELKNVNIFSKTTSLQGSWVKKLYDDSFHAWKVIPLSHIKSHLGKNFVCHSNLSIKQKIVKKFSKFYQEILKRSVKYLSSPSKVLSAVASQFIWYNQYIKTNNNTTYYYFLSLKNLNHIDDLFENDCKMRSGEDLRAKLGLDDNKKFYWRQIIHAIPRPLKELFFRVW